MTTVKLDSLTAAQAAVVRALLAAGDAQVAQRKAAVAPDMPTAAEPAAIDADRRNRITEPSRAERRPAA